MLTPHKIEIIVAGENVTSAVIDGVWDELSQQPIPKNPTWTTWITLLEQMWRGTY